MNLFQSNLSSRRAFSRVEAASLCGVALLSSAILIPALAQTNPFDFFGRARENARSASCASNLKQISLGFLQYEQDYDDKMPPASANNKNLGTNGFGWAGVLQPYLKSTQIFQCPSEKHPFVDGADPTKPNYTDYWMNARLSGLELAKINAPAQILLAGDGDGGSPSSTARYHINTLPASWRTTSGSPARRHSDMANYAFLDGHVKLLKPTAITMATLARMSKYGAVGTFSPR